MSSFNYWLTILGPTFEAHVYSRNCNLSWRKSDTTHSCRCTTKSVCSVFLTASFSIRSQAWYFVLSWSQHFTACYVDIHSGVTTWLILNELRIRIGPWPRYVHVESNFETDASSVTNCFLLGHCSTLEWWYLVVSMS